MTTLISLPDLARLIAQEQCRVLTLDEVAELTGFSKRTIEKYCRADELEHTHEGHHRGMTLAQVDLMVASRKKGTTRTGVLVGLTSEQSGRAQAIEASKRTAARGTRPKQVA